jgi:hypothetical protein
VTRVPWYFILDLALWGAVLVPVVWAWRRLEARERLAPALTAVLVMILQTGNELLSFNFFKAWSFSLAHNRFLGINILGAPLEEYLFWFAFAWLVPFAYAGLSVRYASAAGGKS